MAAGGSLRAHEKPGITPDADRVAGAAIRFRHLLRADNAIWMLACIIYPIMENTILMLVEDLPYLLVQRINGCLQW